jgi:hypothetical protein
MAMLLQELNTSQAIRDAKAGRLVATAKESSTAHPVRELLQTAIVGTMTAEEGCARRSRRALVRTGLQSPTSF